MKIDSRRFFFFIERSFYLLFIFIPERIKRILSKTEHELNSLIKLSEDSAILVEVPNSNKEIIIKKCLEKFDSINTYSSRMLVTDKNYPAVPTSSERLVGRWRTIFIQPHRTHVTQEMLDDELGWLYDEWIMSYDKQFINMGFWSILPKGETANMDANQNVLIDNWKNLLSSYSPTSFSLYRYKNRPYLLLNYKLPANLTGFTGTLFTDLMAEESSEISDICNIQIWINTTTFFITKGVIEINGYVNEEYMFAKFTNVFGGYNEPLEIKIPENYQTMTSEEQSLKITNETELNNFFYYYYLVPQPDLVLEAIKFIGNQNYASKKSSNKMILLFFSCVFSQNESKKDEWQKEIENQDNKTKAFFSEAMDKNVSELLGETKTSPLFNDMCWSAFFATGDTSYIHKIINNLKYIGERKNKNLFFTAATAKWSLASNARIHPKVEATLKKLKDSNDPEIKKMARDMLNKTPERIMKEMNKVVEKQEKKGLW